MEIESVQNLYNFQASLNKNDMKRNHETEGEQKFQQKTSGGSVQLKILIE